MSSFKDKYIQKYAEKLADDGRKLINKAFLTADFKKDKTQNLHDSYGCAVYYKKMLVSGTKRILSQKATQPRYNKYSGQNEYGYNEINDFLDSYRPSGDGLVLVIAVAMFYGEILEKGKGNLKRKYKVISGVSSDIKALADKYKGTVRDINL